MIPFNRGYDLTRFLLLVMAVVTLMPIGLSIIGETSEGKVSFLGLENPMVCKFKERHHMPCATCGLTRGWIALVHGEAITAQQHNKYTKRTFITIMGVAMMSLFFVIFYRKIHLHRKSLLLLVPVLIFMVGWFPIITENLHIYRKTGLI